MGATMALPLLDAMVPGHESRGADRRRVSPRSISATARTCSSGRLPPKAWASSSRRPSSRSRPFRDRTMVFTGLDNFPATDQGDVGGQHPRAAPAFMSCMHPKQTEGSDVEAGTTIDQIIAERICRDTKLPSLEVSVDRNDVVGACDHGYACAYMNSLSWKNADDAAADRKRTRASSSSGCSASARRAEERQARVNEDRSILDRLSAADCEAQRAAGSARPDEARRVLRRGARPRAAHRQGRVVQQRFLGARAAGRRAADLQGIRRADVRSAGAGVPGRHHARQLVHDVPRKHQPLVSGDRPARSASLDVAPRQQPGEDEELREAEHTITSTR